MAAAPPDSEDAYLAAVYFGAYDDAVLAGLTDREARDVAQTKICDAMEAMGYEIPTRQKR